MKHILIILFIYLSHVTAFSQAPNIQWQKCFGGSDEEKAYSMAKSIDGGYVIAGWAYSNDGDVTSINGGNDMWIIKIDSTGTLLWQKCYGAYLGWEVAKSIKQTPDSGYIIAGTADRNGGDVSGLHGFSNTDFWIVKINKTGDLQWQKCLGGTGDDGPFDIQLTSDGGYIVVGETGSGDGDITAYYGGYDAWVAKIDSAGNLQWQKNLGGFLDDGFQASVQQTNDGGFIIAIGSNSFDGILSCNHGMPSSDCFIAKLDDQGNYLWGNCLGGSNGDSPAKILLLNDGSFIIGAGTTSNDGDVTGLNGPSDFWLVKTDSLASLQWQKCFGGSSYEALHSIKKTSDGGYILTGSSESSDSPAFCNNSTWYHDFWVVKVDSVGTYQWSKCMGGYYDDTANEIEETNDGGFLVSGYSASNDGDVSGNHTSGNCGNDPCEDYWVVKLAPLGTSVMESDPFSDFSLHFNNESQTLFLSTFSNKNTKVEMQIFDVTGRILLQDSFTLTNGFNKHQFFTGDLVGGIYFVRLQTNGGGVAKKLVVQ